MQQYVIDGIKEAQRVMGAMLEDTALQAQLGAAATATIECLKNGGKILLAGNGGSAADAQHIAFLYRVGASDRVSVCIIARNHVAVRIPDHDGVAAVLKLLHLLPGTGAV